MSYIALGIVALGIGRVAYYRDDRTVMGTANFVLSTALAIMGLMLWAIQKGAAW